MSPGALRHPPPDGIARGIARAAEASWCPPEHRPDVHDGGVDHRSSLSGSCPNADRADKLHHGRATAEGRSGPLRYFSPGTKCAPLAPTLRIRSVDLAPLFRIRRRLPRPNCQDIRLI